MSPKQTGAGKRLWAPWRVGYIVNARRKKRSWGCLFCQKAKAHPSPQNHVLHRGKWVFTLLNRYPYNNGHLMVAPYRHVGKLQELTPQEWMELGTQSQEAIQRLEEVFSPDGYNLGVNLGRVAGAGIPGHLHLHIVPRWNGDTNFMPVTAQTRVISQSLEAAYRLLRKSVRTHGSSSR